ncbi:MULTISPECIES: acyltransferase family protein [unclassified Bradyrhizobium]|uniref:acyltransferase family protein n=1 Tax=unclassified Bradyrhizobium TaxID=2631580 RepID=UPI003399DC51
MTNLHASVWYRIVPEFVLGTVLYRFGSEVQIPELGSPLAFLAVSAGCVAFLTLGSDLATVLLFALLILVTAEASRQKRLLIFDRPVFVYLGEISYSLYMVHAAVAAIYFRLVFKHAYRGDFLVLLGAATIAVGTAALTHWLVEVPVRRMIVDRFAAPRLAAEPASA